MAGMGLLAVVSTINAANTMDTTRNWLPRVRMLGDLRGGLVTYLHRDLESTCWARGRKTKPRQKRSSAGVIESNGRILKSHESPTTTPEERAL